MALTDVAVLLRGCDTASIVAILFETIAYVKNSPKLAWEGGSIKSGCLHSTRFQGTS